MAGRADWKITATAMTTPILQIMLDTDVRKKTMTRCYSQRGHVLRFLAGGPLLKKNM